MTLFQRLHMPSFAGATEWLNSEPLGPAELRGHVVLVNFWTLTCINWLRQELHVRTWSRGRAFRVGSFTRSAGGPMNSGLPAGPTQHTERWTGSVVQGEVDEPRLWTVAVATRTSTCYLASKAVIRSPESSALAMKPQAPLSSTNRPKAVRSLLEISTTSGGSTSSCRRAATSKPSRSGSWTSRSTTSGRSSSADRSADSPSHASPTIENP